MIEVAISDNRFDQSEKDQLTSLIIDKWNLNSTELSDLLTSAEKQHDYSTSLFEHTKVIKKFFSNEEKIQLMECLWEIAFADGRVDHYEEHTIRKVADLIYVEQREFIRTKIKVRDRI